MRVFGGIGADGEWGGVIWGAMVDREVGALSLIEGFELGEQLFFRPFGAESLAAFTHGLRRFAASCGLDSGGSGQAVDQDDQHDPGKNHIHPVLFRGKPKDGKSHPRDGRGNQEQET